MVAALSSAASIVGGVSRVQGDTGWQPPNQSTPDDIDSHIDMLLPPLTKSAFVVPINPHLFSMSKLRKRRFGKPRYGYPLVQNIIKPYLNYKNLIFMA